MPIVAWNCCCAIKISRACDMLLELEGLVNLPTIDASEPVTQVASDPQVVRTYAKCHTAYGVRDGSLEPLPRC